MRKLLSVPAGLASDRSLPSPAKGIYLVLANLGAQERPDEPICARPKTLLEATGLNHPLTLKRWLARLEQAGWIRIEPAGRGAMLISLTSPGQVELAEVMRRLESADFKGQALTREWARRLVVDRPYQENAEPPFLVNPLTGCPLQYDIYFPPDVAIEFNGPQHYGPTEKYPDAEAATMRRALDLIKLGLSVRHGVHLVIIDPEDLTLERMRAKIKGLLPLRPVEEDDPVIRYVARVSNAYIRQCRRERRQESAEMGWSGMGRRGAPRG
ncbi:MAG: hypothetical protein AB1503_00915 [Bacillota bacterium]